MAKDNTNLIVVGIIVVAIILSGNKQEAADINVGVTVNEQGDNIVPPNTQESTFNLCDWYSGNFPVWLASRSSNCIASSGTWTCDEDNVGCYDIPVWDNAWFCSSSESNQLKYSCAIMQGTYYCGAHEVSCELI